MRRLNVLLAVHFFFSSFLAALGTLPVIASPTLAQQTTGTPGSPVLLLDDVAGNTWVMKGFQVGLNPKYTYEGFVAAGGSNFKKLPPACKFCVRKLKKDLIETPANGVAKIMPDEFFNVHDKTGPGVTNCKP